MGLSLFSFLASIAGIVVSFMLLKEDVISTAHTIFEYFPSKFGVTPSTSWEGAIILGIFVSVLQIISASVAFSEKFPKTSRLMAGVVLISSGLFDNWTDVVFRSGNLTGNTRIATITTLAFYTFGSEIAQGLSWLVFVSLWRLAISDLMWGYAMFLSGISSISSEWNRFKRAAYNKESRERGDKPSYTPNKEETFVPQRGKTVPTNIPTYRPVTQQGHQHSFQSQTKGRKALEAERQSIKQDNSELPPWARGE